jgi:hypothetical protein
MYRRQGGSHPLASAGCGGGKGWLCLGVADVNPVFTGMRLAQRIPLRCILTMSRPRSFLRPE